MRLKATEGNCFSVGQSEGRKVVVFPDGELPLSCYQCGLKCSQGSQLVVVSFPGPSPALHCLWELLHWRPQQDWRKPRCLGTSTSLSSLSFSASPREERSLIHMASPSLANSTTAVKRTFRTSRATSQPPHVTYIVTPQQAAYSYSFFGVKKVTLTKDFKDRIPDAMRQHYLGLFTEECLRFSSSRLEAIEKAQSEEKEVYDQSPSKNKYLNVALHTLKKLRGLVPSAVPGLNKATLYSRLRSYQLTEEQRKEHGFPFAHPEKPGSAMLFTREQPRSPTHRTCCRCGTEYPVSSSGCCLCSDPCVFHWGRIRSIRVPGGSQVQYTCCYAPIGATGCTVAKQHVQDGRKDNLQGFAKTFPKKDWEAHAGIYALDCEMSYTTHGLELTRVTVVDMDLRVIYDTFVKPDNEIVDYNTIFSGVTEADLANTNVRLRDVQAMLLSLFSTETILIGHSLESDLLALKFIHSTVIDTSVLFPHHRGLPYKRSLRGLISQYLNRMIQTNRGGHSSIEDARACMQLVTWKMQEDAKTSSPPQQQTACPKCNLQQKLRVYTSRYTQTPTTMEMPETTDKLEGDPDPLHTLHPET
ncbi:RNA exonuclease 1 homolog [Phodopus roborovskii]|uniref:RNA exonuclease 1 homolog n=1 Tax=Phodopus roborovskii TaxID=109678 RepID=UPI0021E4C87A|nr:RNA exonuclease 1 homolog [Phodopus roborovskii]